MHLRARTRSPYVCSPLGSRQQRINNPVELLPFALITVSTLFVENLPIGGNLSVAWNLKREFYEQKLIQ